MQRLRFLAYVNKRFWRNNVVDLSSSKRRMKNLRKNLLLNNLFACCSCCAAQKFFFSRERVLPFLSVRFALLLSLRQSNSKFKLRSRNLVHWKCALRPDSIFRKRKKSFTGASSVRFALWIRKLACLDARRVIRQRVLMFPTIYWWRMYCFQQQIVRKLSTWCRGGERLQACASWCWL
jgi:hypothetical protein